MRTLLAMLAWVGVLAGPALGASGARSRPQDDALSQAHALHVALLRQPVAERHAADYEAIVAVLEPLWEKTGADATPADAARADSARYEAASVYVAEARDLHRTAAYANAAGIFLDLLRRSPYTAYRRNAEFALAQIQIFHLREPRAAAVWLRDFERRYPADPRAAVAQREVRGERVPEPAYLTEAEATPAALPPVPSPAPPREVLATNPLPATTTAEQPSPDPAVRATTGSPASAASVRMGNVEGVRVFSNTANSSVVVALRREATFVRRALGPHTVAFDISAAGARARRGPPARLAVDDGRIVSVRVSQLTSGTVRVTIETRPGVRLDRGRYFPNPSRLVVAAIK